MMVPIHADSRISSGSCNPMDTDVSPSPFSALSSSSSSLKFRGMTTVSCALAMVLLGCCRGLSGPHSAGPSHEVGKRVLRATKRCRRLFALIRASIRGMR